jgi:integrase/recombinase XerD
MSENNLTQLILSDCVNEFLFDRKAKNRAKTTIRFYQLELDYFSKWLGENKSIEQISSHVIKKYLVEVSAHRNNGGVHASFRSIRALFFYLENEYEIKNPIKKVKYPYGRLEPLPEIPMSEINLLISNCKGKHKNRDIAIFKVLVDSGCRAQEFMDLKTNDVDLETGMIKIQHGKGNKFRITWLGDKGLKALKVYLSERPEIKENTPLFSSKDNQKMSYEGLREMIKRTCKRAEIEYKGIHCFRRTFALTLWRNGVDILSISRLLGHEDLEVTKKYLNIGNEDLREAHHRASPADSLD